MASPLAITYQVMQLTILLIWLKSRALPTTYHNSQTLEGCSKGIRPWLRNRGRSLLTHRPEGTCEGKDFSLFVWQPDLMSPGSSELTFPRISVLDMIETDSMTRSAASRERKGAAVYAQ